MQHKLICPPKVFLLALPLVMAVLFCAILYAGILPVPAALAQEQPNIRYSTSSNTIYIGRPYSSTLPAEAPYVGYPSNPAAPKLSITIPQLATIMQGRKQTNLFIDQGNGIWLVKVNLVIYQNSRLDITTPTVTELRLESYPTGTDPKKYTKVVADGGQLFHPGYQSLFVEYASECD